MFVVCLLLKYWHVYYDISYVSQLQNKKWLKYLTNDKNDMNDRLYWFIENKSKYGNVKYTLKKVLMVGSIVFVVLYIPWLVLYVKYSVDTSYLVMYSCYVVLNVGSGVILIGIARKTPVFDDEIPSFHHIIQYISRLMLILTKSYKQYIIFLCPCF